MRWTLVLAWLIQLACSAEVTRLDATSPARDGDTVDAAAPVDAAADAGPGDAGDISPDVEAPDAMTGCAVAPATSPLDVVTTHATVRGAASDGVRRFRGVRYAAAPIGAQRWRSPEPPVCEPALVSALEYGPRCPQLDDDGTTYLGDEDCLTLNVWTATGAVSRPVMVFIHGGGNIIGSASESAVDGSFTYDGALLARAQGVVVVTIQYRLGGLGFLAHEALGPSGANWGLQDQLAALRWVRDNIAGFGGDPTRVLVFGESAGAVDVCALLAMPDARGLFSAALMQSGGCGQPALAERRTQGLELVAATGCTSAADPIACLRGLSAERIVRARPGVIDVATGRGIDWGPAVDGQLLPESPIDAISAGRAHAVPLVVGSNLDETFRFVPAIASCAAYEAQVRRTFPALASAVLGLYPCADYLSPREAFVALTSDARFICPTRRLARARAAVGPAPTYRYFFTQRLENTRMPLGAFHGLELAFVFGNLRVAGYVPSAGEVALAEAMAGYWARFTATGDPNGDNAPRWPTYATGSDRHLELNALIRAGDGVRTAQCDGWDALVP